MSTDTPLVLLSGIVLCSFIGLSTATLGIAVWKRQVDRRQQRAQKMVREELFERREWADPEWHSWVTSLSGHERTALVTLLKQYLRVIEGPQRDLYLELADALDLGKEARRDAGSDDSDIVTRLEALSTLTKLEQAVPLYELWHFCHGTQRTREAGARLVHKHLEEYERPGACGTDLIVWDGQEPMTIYGLATLMELNDGAGTPLLELAEQTASSWSEEVLIQACTVLGFTRATNPDTSFDWLIPLFDHEQPEVRAAAVRALKQQGWRISLRERIDFDALINDNSPQVRRATYNVLTYWGDADARQLIKKAAISERDGRCQMTVVRAFLALDMDPLTDHPSWPEDAWNWVQADEAFYWSSVTTKAGQP